MERLQGAQHGVAPAQGDAGEAGVGVAVVGELVGEHGVQLGFGEAGQQRQAQVEAARSGQQAQHPGVLGDGGVHVAGETDGVGRPGAGLAGDGADGAPQFGLVRLGDGQSVVAGRGRTEQEQPSDDRNAEQHGDDAHLQRGGGRCPERGRDAGAHEHAEHGEGEQVEAGQEDECAQRAQ